MGIITSSDELELAWRRVRRDMNERHFIVHPRIVNWIEQNLGDWLGNIGNRLSTDYNARPSRFVGVPKSGGLVRPGSILELEDSVVYNLLVGRILPAIIQHLDWSRGDVDTAYPLARDAAAVDWTGIGFSVWRNWREKSVAKLSSKGVEYVVVSDITGFYENIDLQRLSSELRTVGGSNDVVDLLEKCLRNWALPRNEGIPQGYSASDILAKLYLDAVDRHIRNDGFAHVRYVDDIRIFCKSKVDARRAIHRLTAHLYPRGLNLQSAKTCILNKRQARRKFDGVDEIIGDLNRKIAGEISLAGGQYVKPDEVLKALSEHDGPAPEVLERAFHENFSHGSDTTFDSTLLHYLLVRLGKVRSNVAVHYCLDILETRPEETSDVLRYFSSVGLSELEKLVLAEYVGSDQAIYDYQIYQIVRWFYEEQLESGELIRLCRQWTNDQNRDQSIRSYAFAYLHSFGSPSDWAQIEESYGTAMTELERADRAAAVEKLERGRRNAFYARIAGHGDLVARAIRVAKNERSQTSRR